MQQLLMMRKNEIKKLLSIVLTTVVLVSLFSFNTSAVSYDKSTENEIIISETTEYFADGSSITTTVTQQISDVETFATTKTVSGSKTATVKNADGDVLYKFKINGTFSVNIGVSATCTAVSCSANDLASGWSLDSSTTSKSGNTAKATGVFKYKVLFVTTITKETNISLACDANGTLS